MKNVYLVFILIGLVSSLFLRNITEISRTPTEINSSVNCISSIDKIFQLDRFLTLRQLDNVAHYENSHFGYGGFLEYISQGKTKDISQIKELKIVNYNIENLFYHVGRTVEDPETGLSFGVVNRGPQAKPDKKQIGSAKAILDMDPDIVVLEEVESMSVLQSYSNRLLKGYYKALCMPGNDTRGIQVCMLVKKDLPFKFQLHSFKEFKGNYNNKERAIFSRDMPVLVVKERESNTTLFNIFGVHFKSQRDKKGDPRSAKLRRAQILATKMVKELVQEQQGGKVPFWGTGDFNADVTKADEFLDLKELGFFDAFDYVDFKGSRATQTFHPRDGPTVASQLDMFAVDELTLNNKLLISARVYRYLDDNGEEIPLPKTFKERDKNPSDHFPIEVVVDFEKLRAVQLPRN